MRWDESSAHSQIGLLFSPCLRWGDVVFVVQSTFWQAFDDVAIAAPDDHDEAALQ